MNGAEYGFNEKSNELMERYFGSLKNVITYDLDDFLSDPEVLEDAETTLIKIKEDWVLFPDVYVTCTNPSCKDDKGNRRILKSFKDLFTIWKGYGSSKGEIIVRCAKCNLTRRVVFDA
jgi:hypothetical protein